MVIGAGPAGLTVAAELLARTDVRPVVLEMSTSMGGISRTVLHAGNRIDIGGHRFFSKSARVMDWWIDRMPLEAGASRGPITVQGRRRTLPAGSEGPDPEREDRVMLVRPRKSRIYHSGHLFDYPLRLNPDTVRKLGRRRTARIGLSYLRANLRPSHPERTLEDFLVNRFGRELYQTFFESYTEKVWGRRCRDISADWGAQRIKGLSLQEALGHYLRNALPTGPAGLDQKDTETSLIERFLYPKLGPGQMWELVADEVRAGGGGIHTGWRVVEVLGRPDAHEVRGVRAVHTDGREQVFESDLVYSTMPVRDLVEAMAPTIDVPPPVRVVAAGLCYRDFITVGVLLRRLELRDREAGRDRDLTDNWIYIQEPHVQAGRIQIFNNWSPYLVADPQTHWLGLEYFCEVGDSLWSRSDDDLYRLAIQELVTMGFADARNVLDGVVIRLPKTYPAYFGTYDRFDELRSFLDRFDNLTLIGRNGMHRYNNQDHSMLAAMVAVDNLVDGRTDRSNIWSVNTEAEYHEET